MWYRYIAVALAIIALCLFVNHCKNRGSNNGIESLTEEVYQLREELLTLKTDCDDFCTFRDKVCDDIVYIYDNLSKVWGDLACSGNDICDLKKDAVTFNLKQGEEGFKPFDSPAGKLLLSVRDVQPHLDGYKVALDIGNTTSATLTNLKIKVYWNFQPVPEKATIAQWVAIGKETKKRIFTPTKALSPGTWSKVELYISPATLEELKCVEFDVETPNVSLLPERLL